MMDKTLFRALPSIDACLALLEGHIDAPHSLIKASIIAFLDEYRQRIKLGKICSAEEITLSALEKPLIEYVQRQVHPKFQRVLNATGVVVHTNLGRSVLAEEAVQAVSQVCSGYSNLEFDLETGKRGSRYSLVESLLCRLTGAEAALVVNNNAAAVYLTLMALCRGKEAIVARGQLVEIGGSFRIPDIMERSGVILHEVGCTNRVHPQDYINAITSETSALIRIHTSNFRVVGFHSDVKIDELVQIGHERGLLVIEDLGSGSLVDFTSSGLPYEPTVQSVVKAGADVVTFSGDKVLGGPQAGIIVGRKSAIDKIKADPMNRALRVDKMTLAALEATLRIYLDESKAHTHIPTLRMILTSKEELKRRAQRLAVSLRRALKDKADVSLIESSSRVGGGAFPEYDLSGWLVGVAIQGLSAEMMRERLLAGNTPLVGRIVDEKFCLDCRTLTNEDFREVVKLFQALCYTINS